MLRCLPLLQACNQQVEYVDKRHCNLIAFPDDVLRYSQTLEELMLDANQIRELPRGLFRLIQLRKLTLSDNEISRLPPDVANFVLLEELDVSRNDIEDIPEHIKYCKNLQLVDFSNNPLQRLPDGFTHLKSLTHLGLNDVSLTRLPTDIGSLSNLESLELRENLIKYLPASISHLTNLKSLDLGKNMIEELPHYIGSLPSLEELWLDSNEIIDLPLEIGNLRNLTQLDISENKLEQLPEEVGQLSLLTDLILSQNNIQFIPEGIGFLKRLLIFKADQNQIVQLPDSIGNCDSLQELLLMDNLLTVLPLTIGKLKNLKIVNIAHNRLDEIPSEIGSCSCISVLSVRDNHIQKLPSELGNLKDLHVLDVCGNRLQNLPISLGCCSLTAVWLSDNQVQPLLKFQQDVDDVSGEKVLTCFLLPQQPYNIEGTTDTSLDAESSNNHDDWSRDSAAAAVKFAGDEGNAHSIEESHFVRHNTPHPRELKARHGKQSKKDATDFFVVSSNKASKEEGEEICSSIESYSSVDSDNKDLVQAHTNTRTGEGVDQQPADSYTDECLDIENGRDANTSTKVLPKPSITSSTVPSDNSAYEVTSATNSDNCSSIAPSLPFMKHFTSNRPERIVEICIKREPGETLGMSIASGIGEATNQRDVDVYVSRVAEGGPSALAGLKAGDRMISINGKPVNNMGHSSVVKLLKEGDLNVINLVVGREVIDENSGNCTKEMICLTKDENGFGFTIAGGIGSTSYVGSKQSVYVSKIVEGGAADKCGALQVGDRFLYVNGVDVSVSHHDEVVRLLTGSGNQVLLVITRSNPKFSPDERSTSDCEAVDSKQIAAVENLNSDVNDLTASPEADVDVNISGTQSNETETRTELPENFSETNSRASSNFFRSRSIQEKTGLETDDSNQRRSSFNYTGNISRPDLCRDLDSGDQMAPGCSGYSFPHRTDDVEESGFGCSFRNIPPREYKELYSHMISKNVQSVIQECILQNIDLL